MIFMKRVAAAILLIFFMLHLSGCPIMMPFMMGSMLKRGMDKNMKPEMGSAMYELMHESVTALAASRAPYEHILVRRTEIFVDSIPYDEFQQTLLEIMHSKDGWKIHDQGEVLASASESLDTSEWESNQSLAVLDTQLYKGSGKLWLAMQLVDARSNQLFWSGIYSGPLAALG
jgi:hypothetical protein